MVTYNIIAFQRQNKYVLRRDIDLQIPRQRRVQQTPLDPARACRQRGMELLLWRPAARHEVAPALAIWI